MSSAWLICSSCVRRCSTTPKVPYPSPLNTQFYVVSRFSVKNYMYTCCLAALRPLGFFPTPCAINNDALIPQAHFLSLARSLFRSFCCVSQHVLCCLSSLSFSHTCTKHTDSTLKSRLQPTITRREGCRTDIASFLSPPLSCASASFVLLPRHQRDFASRLLPLRMDQGPRSFHFT